MKHFANLFQRLDETKSNNERIDALAEFFTTAEEEEASWGCYYLLGGKTSKLITPKELRDLLENISSIPLWLIEESYHFVGDLAETITLLLPEPTLKDSYHLPKVAETLRSLKKASFEERSNYIKKTWAALSRIERFVFNKLITGSFRIGVQKATVVKGLAKAFTIPESVLNERLTGSYEPTPEAYKSLRSLAFDEHADSVRPFPFYLAYPLENGPESLGPPSDWFAEWKWDGIRSQILCKDPVPLIWSRGEEDVSESFPELVAAATHFPSGFIIDGEIVAYDTGPLPFTTLQKRLNRVQVSKNLQEKYPVGVIAYDLLRDESGDIRSLPLEERRSRLATLLDDYPNPKFQLSSPLSFSSWEDLATLRTESRERKVEGLMLKHKGSDYGQGRRRGSWWKWKIEPLSADMVLIYAQRGHGRRAGLYTDFTFGVWDSDKLVPVAKAYSGLTDKEFETINRFIRNNAAEKFGPVRVVEPKIVMEIAFEGINESSRHKSGIALRFPRMKRIRDDKLPKDADTLQTVRSLLTAPR